MLPIQPPFIPQFFDFKKKLKIQPNTFRSFYISWEDALWHLLELHKIKKNSTVMVPSFFCWDVVENMQAHGLQKIVYPVDKNFQTNPKIFAKLLKKHQPNVIVIFHAVGITNELFENKNLWLENLPKNSILIEDCVHKIIDPKKITFITKKHILMNSLRKVVPVQGSQVFSQFVIPQTTMQQNLITFWYRTQIIFWWTMMQFFLTVVFYSKSKKIQKIGNQLAEKSMKIGYDIVGDHNLPGSGSAVMNYLSKFIATESIKTTKQQQVELYETKLESLQKNNNFFIPKYTQKDKKELRGFPLGIELPIAEQFLEYVRKNSILVRFELDDSLWAKQQKVVYLPLGPHVTEKDILFICNKIKNFPTQSN